MIDYATEIVLESAIGYKELPNDEWFFKVHWEGDPTQVCYKLKPLFKWLLWQF